MFKIDSNQVIKMSRGDNIKFPLFLNKGSKKCPIRYEFEPGDGCEIYFYIFNYNSSIDCPLLEKVFTAENDLWYNNDGTTNNDIKIELSPDDPLINDKYSLKDLCEGEYLYQLKAKLLDREESLQKGENVYVINTITNRHPLYIIDDDYNRTW